MTKSLCGGEWRSTEIIIYYVDIYTRLRVFPEQKIPVTLFMIVCSWFSLTYLDFSFTMHGNSNCMVSNLVAPRSFIEQNHEA